MSEALKRHLTEQNKPVPQTQQADPQQAPNNAGGFSFVVSPQARLERFLMLGTDGGTYYVNEAKLTEQNVDFLVSLIKENPRLVLDTTVRVSHSGRAYRNSSAIFVMSLLFKHAPEDFKKLLRLDFSKVVRTSTHLFEFASFVELLGGWGQSKMKAVAGWYTEKTSDQLAYQAVKYRQRDGWTHRDLFRLTHPKGIDQNVGNFILGKETLGQNVPPVIGGFKLAQQAKTIKELIEVLTTFPNLPWEAIPTQFHKEPKVWQKLFENGQLSGQALLRQITRLARLGLFKDMVFAREYANRLVDAEMIAKTRLHPIQYLLALVGHTEGQIQRGPTASRYHMYGGIGSRSKDWQKSPIIVDALNEGFYKAFEHVESSNKRTFLAVDVSSSMDSMAMGIDLTCAQVSAAMAMTIARTEPYYDIKGFTAGSGSRRTGTTLTDLGITANTPLQDAMRKVQRANFGSTDCSLPMEYAIQNKLEIDTFIVITDNETYLGKRHPHVTLQDYRQRMGIDAKLIVMGMTATEFTIADPKDRGMFDISGADTATPRLVADFSAGRI